MEVDEAMSTQLEIRPRRVDPKGALAGDRGAVALASPRWERAKRTIDIAIALVVLVLLAPLLVLAAIAIRLETPGPLLFRQERYGRGRRPFLVYKFRSMYQGVSPEAHRQYIARLAIDEAGAGPGLKKLTRDPRVTRVGSFLRRTSIDELPQLINVLRGEMSIVGPRPALAYELEFYEPEHYVRFSVRPGLTGLWQVSGRNEIGFIGMLDLDVQYARSTCPELDAKILLRTPGALMRGRAA
ncbi:MAG TPA: sugar transferase [Solirubrobacteraceae bacterium]|nr:sugar transferase [Solirubrobacteraceae bacterium]